jgi:hypothetical protein
LRYLFIHNCILPVILLLLPAICHAQNNADSTKADSLLMKQIEEQMKVSSTGQASTQPSRSAASANPDIGVIGDFQGSYTSLGKKNFDAYLNETEVSLQAVVDPYARADFFVSFGRDDNGKYGVTVEEGYLTTLSLPLHLQLRAGKFKEAVGRINPTHAHALPFVDLPNAYVNYFGDGLNDEGLSLSWLVPNKKFYQEVIVQATSGKEQSPSFYRGDNNRFLYLGHLKNFFTLNDNATLELGLTGITGPNDSARVTNIGSVDLTYKWKPVKMNTYQSFTWQTEIYFHRAGFTETETKKSFGMYSFMQYQLSKRWFLTGRYDYAQKPMDRTILEKAYSLTGGWYATEFSKMEFETKITDSNRQSTYFQAWLRWIFVIGAHGAHQY